MIMMACVQEKNRPEESGKRTSRVVFSEKCNDDDGS